MNSNFLIYGATGYTGKLTARIAKEQGLTPILAGRNPDKLKSVAQELGFDYRVASLDDASELDAALSDVSAVLHIAGPFSATSTPMFEACLRTNTHYIDITGEIDVFESLAQRDGEAKAKGIMAMPGAGFDVVPTDCMAAYLKSKLPSATHLKLSIEGLEKPSRGTAKSGWETINRLTRVRRDGEIVTLSKPLTHQVDFGDGMSKCMAFSWSDVSAAYYTTGIPNIEVYAKVIRGMKLGFTMGRYFGWWLKTGFMQRYLKNQVDKYPEGPSDAYRAENRCVIIGEVEDDNGNRQAAKISTCNGYTFTALAGLLIANKVSNGNSKPGFLTPAGLFGPDLVLEIEGCSRNDL